jgi:hypothetical protein
MGRGSLKGLCCCMRATSVLGEFNCATATTHAAPGLAPGSPPHGLAAFIPYGSQVTMAQACVRSGEIKETVQLLASLDLGRLSGDIYLCFCHTNRLG